MNIEMYIKMRDAGKTVEEIREYKGLSDATAYTLELGYTCYLKRLSLDVVILCIEHGEAYKLDRLIEEATQ